MQGRDTLAGKLKAKFCSYSRLYILFSRPLLYWVQNVGESIPWPHFKRPGSMVCDKYYLKSVEPNEIFVWVVSVSCLTLIPVNWLFHCINNCKRRFHNGIHVQLCLVSWNMSLLWAWDTKINKLATQTSWISQCIVRPPHLENCIFIVIQNRNSSKCFFGQVQ